MASSSNLSSLSLRRMKIKQIIITLLHLAMIFDRSSAIACTNLPSFLTTSVGRGIDIASIDLYPRFIDLQKGYTMFKEPLLSFNCDKNEVFYLQDKEYQLPDEVFRIYDQSSQDYTRHGIDYKDELDYRRKMALVLGHPLVDGVFRSSPTYRRIKREEHPRIRDRVQYVQTRKIVLLREPYSLKLNDKVESEFKRLPEEYNDNPRAYEEFIEKYGTHYFHKIYFGEVARIEFERISDDEKQEIIRLVQKQNQSELAKQSIFSNKNSELDFSKEFIYKVNNLIKFGNTFAEEQSILFENDRNWRLIRQDELRRKIFTVYGGEIDFNANVTYQYINFNLNCKRHLSLDSSQRDLMATWVNRDLYMWPLKGKITPIDSLIRGESVRKESFKKAIFRHLEASELGA